MCAWGGCVVAYLGQEEEDEDEGDGGEVLVDVDQDAVGAAPRVDHIHQGRVHCCLQHTHTHITTYMYHLNMSRY